MKAQYSHGPAADFEYSVQRGVLVIIDLDGGSKSVTNDAESVVQTIQKALKLQGQDLPKIIIYRDSEGVFDGVHASDVNNIRFYHLGEADLLAAIEKAQKLAG